MQSPEKQVIIAAYALRGYIDFAKGRKIGGLGMSVHAFVNFNGNCREAVEFYAKVFELPAPTIATFGEYHAEVSEEEKNHVMYTYLEIAGSMVQFSDSPAGMPLTVGNNISLSVQTNDQSLLKKWYPALSEGGTIHMPLQETVWSKCYASFTDKFGICWQFNQQGE